MSERTHTGRCLCGGVHIEFCGDPRWVAHCHCESCRRFSGAAVATWMGVPRDAVKFVGQERAIFESVPGIRWGSCPTCGSSLSYEADRCADEVHLLMGAMDQPQDFPPQGHSFRSERIEWLRVDEQLPDSPEPDAG